jgi:hypothetical protein
MHALLWPCPALPCPMQYTRLGMSSHYRVFEDMFTAH